MRSGFVRGSIFSLFLFIDAVDGNSAACSADVECLLSTRPNSAPPLAVPNFECWVCQAPFEDAWRYALGVNQASICAAIDQLDKFARVTAHEHHHTA